MSQCRICKEPTGAFARLYSDGLCGKHECYQKAFGAIADPICDGCGKIASVICLKEGKGQLCIDCLPENLRGKHVCSEHTELLDFQYYCWKCSKEENNKRKQRNSQD